MKYLVGHESGELPEQATVYAVKRGNAVNLTAHAWAIETDLMGLILDDQLTATAIALIDSAPPVVGHARTPQRWLRSSETIEVEIEGIGICYSPIVAEESMYYV